MVVLKRGCRHLLAKSLGRVVTLLGAFRVRMALLCELFLGFTLTI